MCVMIGGYQNSHTSIIYKQNIEEMLFIHPLKNAPISSRKMHKSSQMKHCLKKYLIKCCTFTPLFYKRKLQIYKGSTQLKDLIHI